jgi:transglutaminase-like putative cysteine protease
MLKLARFGRGRWWLQGIVAAGLLVAGFLLGNRDGEAEPAHPTYHDNQVVHPEELQSLVVPEAPEVVALARELQSVEAAYAYVRDRIAFEPSVPAGSPAQILRDGRASCLGKATLLTSLCRALGVPAASIRVMTGQVSLGGSLQDHAWVDLEYGSLCLQLDATDLLGVNDFLRFPGNEYVRSFVFRELFCFNDAGFAVVSQLNRLKGTHPQVQ